MSRFTSTPMQNVELMEHMDRTLREGDVIVNTQGKTGQTLLQMLLWSLKSNGATDDSTLFANSPWLEKLWFRTPRDDEDEDDDEPLTLNTVAEQAALCDALESPRVFKQHVSWDQVAAPTEQNVTVHYLTVTRHIEDLPYSMYRHHMSMTTEVIDVFFGRPRNAGGKDTTSASSSGSEEKRDERKAFDDFFDQWVDSSYRWEWYRDMWEWVKSGRAKLVRFEDMATDIEAVARDLLDHLGWPEPVDMPLVISRTDRLYMTDKKLFGSDRIFAGGFVKSGKVGENRGNLNSDQKRRLRAKCEAELDADLVRHLYRE